MATSIRQNIYQSGGIINIKKEFILFLWILQIAALAQSQIKISIALQPFGPFSNNYIDTIKTGIQDRYGNLQILVLPQRDLPRYAYYKPRNRYRAELILQYLDTLPGSHIKIIGLTSKDISTTKGEYYDWGIFGLGAMSGKPCVVSTFRLKKKKTPQKLFLTRLKQVVNHELGHTFGLDHCPTKGCLMEDAKGTIKTVDASKGLLCEKCQKWLEMIIGQ